MRRLHSVGDTLARPGESIQDVLNRREWGESGPFFGRAEFIVAKLADPEFLSGWSDSPRPDEIRITGSSERLKFVMAAEAVLGLVFDNIREGNVAKARRYIEVFNNVLKIPYVLNEDATEIHLPIPGYEGGLKWPVGPNLPD